MKREDRQKVWKKYGCKCAYCGEDLEYSKMQVDHIVSKIQSGQDKMDNYNPSCRQCNFYKGGGSLELFRSNMKTLIERIKKPFIVRLAIKYGMLSIKPFDGKFHFEKYND